MSFSRPGAIDLSALKQSAPAPAASGGAPAPDGASFVVDVTEQDFQQVALEASLRHVVVLSLWSPRSPQSGEFNALLARVANSFGGQLLLAQVDVDTSPAIAQAVGAQGVPFVLGLVGGQPVPLFQGTAAEEEVRRLFEELVRVAVQNGVTGRAAPQAAAGAAAAPAEEEPADPRFADADAKFAEGDFAGAVAEYEKLAAQYPADTEVVERLAGARLLQRCAGADLQAARTAAAERPDDVEAQMLVADLDVSGGHVDDAFDRLITLVRRLPADQREPVRLRLVDLFTVVGAADPRVAAARRKLATALY
jgi:putative thioredoxin